MSSNRKMAVAAKIAPDLYKKVEKFQKQHKIKTKSRTLEVILTEYFSCIENRQVTLRLPEESKGGNTNLWLISELEQIEAHIEKLKKEVTR